MNTARGVVRIVGKGSKERLVLMEEQAVDWIERYLMPRFGGKSKQ